MKRVLLSVLSLATLAMLTFVVRSAAGAAPATYGALTIAQLQYGGGGDWYGRGAERVQQPGFPGFGW